jgi:Zn finger protein HypA/HybF involved in hydrogenase expression
MKDSEWADLYGEEPGEGFGWFAEAARQAELRRGSVYCKNCDDFIKRDEMKRYTRDDETVDLLCPGCDSVLVEDV